MVMALARCFGLWARPRITVSGAFRSCETAARTCVSCPSTAPPPVAAPLGRTADRYQVVGGGVADACPLHSWPSKRFCFSMRSALREAVP
jgi:hypothetical protein